MTGVIESGAYPINVVTAFKTLMRGILWQNPLNRFTINEAISWVKVIKKFPHEDPYKDAKVTDTPSLKKEMRSSVSIESVSNTKMSKWRRELHGSTSAM